MRGTNQGVPMLPLHKLWPCIITRLLVTSQHRDVGAHAGSPLVPCCCLLLLLLTHRTLTVLSPYHCNILCATPTTIIHCLPYLSVSARHRLPACLIARAEANLPPRHARAPARAINTHPSTPHPSNHQSPITHSLTHPPLSLSSSFTKQHTHTIRTYLRTTLHSYVHHCLSLALVRYPRLHAASINPSPDRLYSALSSRRRSETASIPACFACQHLTHPTLQPAIN